MGFRGAGFRGTGGRGMNRGTAIRGGGRGAGRAGRPRGGGRGGGRGGQPKSKAGWKVIIQPHRHPGIKINILNSYLTHLVIISHS